MVDEAREKGPEVTMDLHTYMARCTLMSSFIPQWDFEGTIGDFTAIYLAKSSIAKD